MFFESKEKRDLRIMEKKKQELNIMEREMQMELNLNFSEKDADDIEKNFITYYHKIKNDNTIYPILLRNSEGEFIHTFSFYYLLKSICDGYYTPECEAIKEYETEKIKTKLNQQEAEFDNQKQKFLAKESNQ